MPSISCRFKRQRREMSLIYQNFWGKGSTDFSGLFLLGKGLGDCRIFQQLATKFLKIFKGKTNINLVIVT